MTIGRYHAILLAAGQGSRFGGGKLLAMLGGTMLIRHALMAACSAPVEGVVVVTGADAVTAAVEGFDDAGPPIRLVHCADHALGMSASLRCGLAALSEDAAGAFIFLADMPHVPGGIAHRLAEAVEAGAVAAAPGFEDRLGHPVLIRRVLFDRFAGQSGDGGGQKILRALGEQLAIVPVDSEDILIDIDTPADLARAARRIRSAASR